MNKEQFGNLKHAVDAIYFDMLWATTKNNGEGEMPHQLKLQLEEIIKELNDHLFRREDINTVIGVHRVDAVVVGLM